MNRLRRPPDELLAAYAPLEMWRLAEAQAERSPLRTHRTGCVLFYGMNHGRRAELYSKGCSHTHAGGRATRSVHAEQHALWRLPPEHGGAKALIVTLTVNGNYASCSRPCQHCAEALAKHVVSVIYAERTNDGNWAIRETSSHYLLNGYLKLKETALL